MRLVIVIVACISGCAAPADPNWLNKVFSDPVFQQGLQLMTQPPPIQPQPMIQPSINCTTRYVGNQAYTHCN